MKNFIHFLTRLSEIGLFSFLLVNQETEEVIVQRNLTSHHLSSEQLKRMSKQTDLIYNYYVQDQKLLLLVYQLIDWKQTLILFIDDEVGNFVSYNDQLLKIAETIHLFATGNEFTKKEIQVINQNVLYLKESVIDDILSKQIEQQLYHHDFESEELLFATIKDGDEQGLRQRFYGFQKNTKMGKLATESELRSRKNLLIVAVAISTRYAIKGGVPHERAYTLSDKLIQDIEKKTHFNEMQSPELELMLLFCQEVIKYKHLHYSKNIKKTCEFITKNIYSDLSVPLIASYTNYSIPHLSKMFKKETGLTINQYVTKQRIEESKRLLEANHYDLTTISSLLHFTDVSYFIKVFKKHEQMTPKEYWHKKN